MSDTCWAPQKSLFILEPIKRAKKDAQAQTPGLCVEMYVNYKTKQKKKKTLHISMYLLL